jgi:hypothetical protein
MKMNISSILTVLVAVSALTVAVPANAQRGHSGGGGGGHSSGGGGGGHSSGGGGSSSHSSGGSSSHSSGGHPGPSGNPSNQHANAGTGGNTTHAGNSGHTTTTSTHTSTTVHTSTTHSTVYNSRGNVSYHQNVTSHGYNRSYTSSIRGVRVTRNYSYRSSAVRFGFGGRYYNGNFAFYRAYYPFGFYSPFYYGFRSRFYFGWGWGGFPWFNYYGYYYQPYPYYNEPCDWLFDNMMGTILADRYDAEQAEADVDTSDPVVQADQVVLGTDVKAQVQSQVKAEIDARSKQSTIAFEEKMKDSKHIFVVSEDLNVPAGSDGSQCELATGDMIKFSTINGDGSMAATVVSSKVQDCRIGTTVSLSAENLMSFENDFNRQLDESLIAMKNNPSVTAQMSHPVVDAEPLPADAETAAPATDASAQ